MSDTPRTDIVEFTGFLNAGETAVPSDFARRLEAENAELRKLVEQMKCCGNCQYHNAKIEICEHPENSEDAVLNDRCELWESATGVNTEAAEGGGE